MWFDLQGTFDHATNSLDFFRGNSRRLCAPGYQTVDAGGRHYAQHSFEAAVDEQVVGKQREQNIFLTILPTMNGLILGKKYVESLAHEGLGNHFLVLMASIKRVPPGTTTIFGKTGDFSVP
jgi:hypothetical protein